MQLSFDTASGLINGVRLTGGGVETNIQTVSLDIDNHGAKIQSILPPKPAPKPEPLPTPQAVASQTGSTLHKAHTQDVGGLYTTSAAGVDAPAKATNTNNNLTEFVENVVSQDARNWAVYRFNRGTVRNAKITHENGSEKTIYGDFTYSGLFGAASPGWVKIKVKNGQVDCVLFWDEGGCRSLGFTPSMAILGASVGPSASVSSSINIPTHDKASKYAISNKNISKWPKTYKTCMSEVAIQRYKANIISQDRAELNACVANAPKFSSPGIYSAPDAHCYAKRDLRFLAGDQRFNITAENPAIKPYYDYETCHEWISKRCLNGDCTSKCLSGNCNNGVGEEEFNDGAIYSGYFKNSKLNGQGELVFINGSYQKCNWINDACETGVLILVKDGETYKGSFKNGKLSNQGELSFANGTKYIGQFDNEQLQHGPGVLYATNGTILRRGRWKNGKFVLNSNY